MNFTSLPVSQTSFIMHRRLQLGYRYFATVRCTNRVGLTAVSFSSGIVYDDTPPDIVFVHDGNYQRSNRTLFITFKFVDAESGIKAYRVRLCEGGSSNRSWPGVLDSFRFDGNVTKATLQLSKELFAGKAYHVNVTAVNRVGLETTKQSDGFVVDTSPPVCLQVWDGKSEYQGEQEYASSSNRFIISWVCHDNESPILRYRFAVKDVHTSEYIIPLYALKTRVNSTGSAIITGGGGTTRKVLEGHIYTVGIELVNAVGMKMVYWTNGVLTDSTPPQVTSLKLTFYPQGDSLKGDWLVIDKQSGLRSVSWGLGTAPEINDIKNYTAVSSFIRNVSISSYYFRQGVTCFLNLLAVNKAGLSSKTSSNAVIMDRSAPNP